MKLILSGGSGYVAAEVIRQSLASRQITSLVVLSRRQIDIPEHANAGKIKQVLMQDYDKYPDDVKKEFSGADACIWTVAITPSKSRSIDPEKVRHVCETCALAGMKAMIESDTSKPFRFIYMSGSTAQRDQTKPASGIYGNYMLMRGEAENKVLSFAKEHANSLEIQIAKPGLITSYITVARSAASIALKTLGSITSSVYSVTTEEISAAMLSQVLNGFDKETLENADLQSIGRKALAQ